MPTRALLLTALFGAHWVAFVALYLRSRRTSLLLPIGVFTLLVLVQLLRDSTVMVDVGPLPPYRLPTLLRATAIVLAVPSLATMGRRIADRRSRRQGG